MKYRVLLTFLKGLMYIKRGIWWFGNHLVFLFGKVIARVWLFGSWVGYKISYGLRQLGWQGPGSKIFKRDRLHLVLLLIVVFLAIPQTKLLAKKDAALVGQKTIAYNLFGAEEDYSLEEISASAGADQPVSPSWKQGSVSNDYGSGLASDILVRDQELAGIMAGGTALSKPIILPGAVAGGTRDQESNYEVQTGDTLGGIAYEYGVSVATVMWANNLTLRTLLKPGQTLKIPPTTGVMHTVRKGDNIKKIALYYDAKVDDIIKFNKLEEDGADIKTGERLMVPGGVMPQARAIAGTPRTAASVNQRAAPPGSRQVAGVSGFVWPCGVHTVTQYYSWTHHALDIAGPWQTPNYAAKAGTVVVSQCGWNSGYGCYIIIDHGGGVRTLYGHNSKLLVSPGDYVSAGQTIGLMGNTGNVRGRTGIHLHFEIQINGARVNPLGYVR